MKVLLYGPFFPSSDAAQGKDQRTEVVKKCKELIDQDPAWKSAPEYEFEAIDLMLQPPPTDTLRTRVEEIQATIRNGIYSDMRLHGAWLELVPFVDKGGRIRHYDVVLWLDPARADRQRAGVESLLRRHLDADYRICEEVPLPLTALAARLQDALVAEIGSGSWIGGARYDVHEEDAAYLQIDFTGRLFPAVDEQVHKTCLHLIDTDRAFRELGPRKLWPEARPERVYPKDTTDVLKKVVKGLRETLALQVKKDPLLQGAWVEVAPCLDPFGRLEHYDVQLWLDRSIFADQKSQIETLLHAYRTPLKIVEETHLPFSELLASLRQRVEEIYGPGRYVSGAFYEAQGDDIFKTTDIALTLFGRVWKDVKTKDETKSDDQKDMKRQINEQCNALMARDPVWQSSAPWPAAEAVRLHSDIGSADSTKGWKGAIDRGLIVHALHPESSRALKEIREELKRNARLHGAWVDLAECYDPWGNPDHYDVCVWVDPAATGNHLTDVQPAASPSPAPAAGPSANQAVTRDVSRALRMCSGHVRCDGPQ